MNKRNLIILLIILGSILFLVVTLKADKGRDPITITASTSIEEVSLDGLIAEADLIAIGEVEKLYPGRWNTPNGKLPIDITAKTITTKNIIYTDLNFLISQVVKGKNENSVRLRTFGGQVDQDTMIVSSEVSLEVEQTYLLFLFIDELGLTANIDSGHYIVLGSIQGVYKIDEGKAVSFRDEWPLDELIAYIQKSLSAESPSPALSPVPTELLIETLTPLPTAPTETPSPAVTFTEFPAETPTETVSPTP